MYRDQLAVKSIKFYDITGLKKKGDLITDSLLVSATWNGKWSCTCTMYIHYDIFGIVMKVYILQLKDNCKNNLILLKFRN